MTATARVGEFEQMRPHLLSVAHDLLAAHVRHQTESACKAFVAL